MNSSIIVGSRGQYAFEIRKIRNAVFTHGQGIGRKIDFDGEDAQAIHVLANIEHIHMEIFI